MLGIAAPLRPVPLITTARTTLRGLTTHDGASICALLNQPSFLRYIGDRMVRSPDDASVFIETRYRRSYRDHGFGLYAIERRDSGAWVGICGLVRREELDHPDIGFAVLPEHEGQGLAFEAATATLTFARDTFDVRRVLAIATPDNLRSHRLLARLGFESEGQVTLPGGSEPLLRFARASP